MNVALGRSNFDDERPADNTPITLDFPFLEKPNQGIAHIEEWVPPSLDGSSGDIAGLRLTVNTVRVADLLDAARERLPRGLSVAERKRFGTTGLAPLPHLEI